MSCNFATVQSELPIEVSMLCCWKGLVSWLDMKKEKIFQPVIIGKLMVVIVPR